MIILYCHTYYVLKTLCWIVWGNLNHTYLRVILDTYRTDLHNHTHIDMMYVCLYVTDDTWVFNP